MSDQVQVIDLQTEKQIQIITEVNETGTFHNKATTTVEAEDFDVVIKDLGKVVLRSRPEHFVNPKEGDVIALVNIIKGYLFLEDPEDITQQILNAQLEELQKQTVLLTSIQDDQKSMKTTLNNMYEGQRDINKHLEHLISS